jgi:pimeloyl-ACP methyl ester carboxylesterase
MKRVIFSLGMIALVSLSGCSFIKSADETTPSKNDYTIVIIGGLKSKQEQMILLRSSLPGSIVIVPEKCIPLWLAADTVLRQIKEKGVKGKLVLIGYSWGGLIAREIDGEHPGLVKAVVTIATPSGNFGRVPNVIADFTVRPQDSNSTTPLFLIGGYVNIAAQKRWWMETGESDGVVDVSSILATGKRAVTASVFIEGEHGELLQSTKVADQIKTWLGQIGGNDVLVADANRTMMESLLSNRKKALLQWAFTTGLFPVILLDSARDFGNSVVNSSK